MLVFECPDFATVLLNKSFAYNWADLVQIHFAFGRACVKVVVAREQMICVNLARVIFNLDDHEFGACIIMGRYADRALTYASHERLKNVDQHLLQPDLIADKKFR